jgi:apolipoprotein N-acyltransferase
MLRSGLTTPTAVLPWLGAVLTGLLLTASFPPFSSSECAWVALVPLLVSLRCSPSREAFALGLTAGAVFWLTCMWWLTYVTLGGWLCLGLYCAVYLGLFALGMACWWRRFGAASWPRNLLFVLGAPAFWVCLEYARSTLFTGFAWNTLAISQYDVAPIRQMAAWGGVYVISAALMMFNAAVAATLLRYRAGRGRWGRSAHPELAVGFLAMALCSAVGIRVIRGDRLEATPVHIGVVQTSIPQFQKWVPETVPLIYRRLLEQTAALQQTDGLDLIVWPETALPDDVRYSEESFEFVQHLMIDQVPLLLGSMDFIRHSEDEVAYYNSAFLFGRQGDIEYGYDKQHLVMFGEYVPLRTVMPFLSALTPNMESFSPGKSNTLFRLETPDVAFSTLICFEDAIPPLGRQAVRQGAQFLVNLTNDAWFRESSASRQHMAHSVFRSVENRVPVVRCANNGISCFIDHLGVVREELRDAEGTPFGPGHLARWVLVPTADRPQTFYTRHGDLFAYLCMGISGLFAVALAGNRAK